MQSTATQRQIPFPRLGALIGPAGPSLFEALFPRATVAHKAIVAFGFVVLTAVLANARFYLPDNPVPITLQTAGVLATGAALGWRWGMASAVTYYAVGLAGAPVFASQNGGWNYAAHGVTGGYLLGFILATAATGYLTQRGWNRGRSLWAVLIGGLLVYVPALIWLSVFDFGWPAPGELFSGAMYPFIPGDLVKIIAVSAGAGALWRLADRRRANTNS
jgi:biotin transport system substrate-specific component